MTMSSPKLSDLQAKFVPNVFNFSDLYELEIMINATNILQQIDLSVTTCMWNSLHMA